MHHDIRYRLAAGLMGLSAVIHLPVAALDFASYGVSMIVGAALWSVLGLGVWRGWRWCAWLGFLGLAFGLSVAIAGAMGTFGLLATLFLAMALTDLAGAAVLFTLLWRAPGPRSNAA
ncbi:hypothetical protein [Pseudooceanicola aestuarii]|uniref:hypothetical protein n=1 Tax=Pseudooceanicola aestuarii TaxID=2697319 RepID=UPI0013CF660A|nr:hypothetical protein [Pseudooceanicola aestuarii]